MDASSADTAMTNNGLSEFPKAVDDNAHDQSTLKQVEGMLDYIRANLDNIRRTWGIASSQYRAASEIMQEYFNENIKKLNLNQVQQQASLDELIAKLSLDESDPLEPR